MAEDEDNEVNPALGAAQQFMAGNQFAPILGQPGIGQLNPQFIHQMGQQMMQNMPMLDNNALENIQAQLQQAQAAAAAVALAQQNGENNQNQPDQQPNNDLDEDMV